MLLNWLKKVGGGGLICGDWMTNKQEEPTVRTTDNRTIPRLQERHYNNNEEVWWGRWGRGSLPSFSQLQQESILSTMVIAYYFVASIKVLNYLHNNFTFLGAFFVLMLYRISCLTMWCCVVFCRWRGGGQTEALGTICLLLIAVSLLLNTWSACYRVVGALFSLLIGSRCKWLWNSAIIICPFSWWWWCCYFRIWRCCCWE